jgi:hypothetical protein
VKTPGGLKKKDDGHYEITHQKDTQAKVITPEYDPGIMDDASLAPVPVHEVNSSKEAKGTFEEYAKDNKQTGMDPLIGGGDPTGGSAGEGDMSIGFRGQEGDDLGLEGGDGDLLEDAENIPPGVLAIALLLTGVLLLSTSGISPGEPIFLVGAGMVGISLIVFGWAGLVFNRQGWEETIEFLGSTDEKEQSSSESSSTTENEHEKTPPTPEKLKRQLIFDRANQECEWCGEFIDNPEVHHIKPRSEGGPNKKSNLVVLCPTCHRKADSGGISRTKLRQKLRHATNEQS